MHWKHFEQHFVSLRQVIWFKPIGTRAEVLFSLASIAMFHKDQNLSDAGPAVISGLAYVLPDKCLPFAVKSVHESLASAEAVHRLEDAIGLLSGALPHHLVLLLSTESRFMHI